MRAEAGQVLGAISDEEVALLTRVFERNARLVADHQFHRFDGDALLFVAAAGRTGAGQAGRWEPYIAGEIAEIEIACEHTELIRPERLAEIWTALAPTEEPA